MKNTYMLITVVKRSISTEQFPTYEQARKTMLEELGKDVLEYEDLTQEEWDEICQMSSYEADYAFAFDKSSAWSNLDDDNLKDWLIVGLD